MQLIHHKQFYIPQFPSLASISVRRLAWAMGINMPKAIDIIVSLLPSIVDQKKVCKLCRDKSKCDYCTFSALPPQQEQDALPHFTEQEQDAIAAIF